MERVQFEALDHQGYIRKCTDMAGVPGWVLFDSDGEAILASPRKSDLFFEAARQDIRVVQPN